MNNCRKVWYSKQIHPAVTPYVLNKVARAMVPFYKAIVSDDRFAKLWSRAVVRGDLKRLETLLFRVSPDVQQTIGTNAIGYYISFPFPKLYYPYVNGIAIPPGKVQFHFDKKVHQKIAKAIIPLYRELAKNFYFRRAFSKAINNKDKRALRFMVKSLVKTRALRSVIPDGSGGVVLSFTFPFSKYTYQNVLFFDEFQ